MSLLPPEGKYGGVFSETGGIYLLLLLWVPRDVFLTLRRSVDLYTREWDPLRSAECQLRGLGQVEWLHFIRVDEMVELTG